MGTLFVFAGILEAGAGWRGGRASVLVLAPITPELCRAVGTAEDWGQHPGEGTDP